MNPMNPWSDKDAEGKTTENLNKSFEDDFLTSQSADSLSDKLPDSDEYLGKLERKLHRLQNNADVLQQLKDRREHCIERLLASDEPLEQRISDLELDQPTGTGGGQQQLLRLINPHQPLTIGEVLHLVKHDELDKTEDDQEDAQKATPTQSSPVEVDVKPEEPPATNTPPPSR